ncbi:MAG: NGG1p interacting factor NIF3 [Minisyncoccia bacterium]
MAIKKEKLSIEQLFARIIEKGIDADFRSREEIDDLLERKRIKYEKLSDREKKDFDMNQLKNPYSDSRILNISEPSKIKKILAGIDIGSGELFLADKMGNVDLVIGHHPLGIALSNLSDVMHLQADVLHKYGVPINIAESLLVERITEVHRGISPINHNQTVDLAKALNINLLCAHTPADNLAANYLEKKIKKGNIKYVDDILSLLKSIPEYQFATKIGAGPKLFVGQGENHTGKIVLSEITGGTSGSPKMYEKMSQAGIGTIVGMHMSEEHRKEAEKSHINVVVAGHISSDSLGMNLMLDEFEKSGIEVIACSGLTRVKRF